MTNPSSRKANAHILNNTINHDSVHLNNQNDKLNHLSVDLDLIASSNDLLVSQTANNIGIYQASIHMRDINLPQINTTISGVKDMTQSTRDACIHLRDVNLPQIHTDIHTLKTSNESKLDTINTSLTDVSTGADITALKTSNEGKLDTINTSLSGLATESTLQIISEFNCDTTDTTITSSVLPAGASTSVLQTRSWGTTQTISGNLIVLASSVHAGSPSFTTIPQKPILIYVKSHNAITDWFASIEGSIDNSIWMPIPTTEIPVLNLQGLRSTPQQQASVYVNPSFPYLRVKITNANGADRGFEIKVIQTH